MLLFLKEKLHTLTYHSIVLKLIAAIAATGCLLIAFTENKFDTAAYFQQFPLPLYIGLILFFFVVLAFTVHPRYDGYILLPVLTALFILTNYTRQDTLFALAGSLVLGGFVFFLAAGTHFPEIPKKALTILCILCGVFLAVFVGVLTIVKYLSHLTPTYDFGIFSQMYHYMSETLIPYTTCERQMLLSHFAVHFSPILYIALPFYLIFPHPTTILAVQAIAVAAAVFPLCKLCRHFSLSGKKRSPSSCSTFCTRPSSQTIFTTFTKTVF